jgi:TrmH family RNA methyltransferase
VIRSPQNQKLKDIRRLRRSKGAHALLEGPHLLAEALLSNLELDPVLVTPEFAASAAGADLLGRLKAPALLVEAALLASLADADAPQGVVAVASLPRRGTAALPCVMDGVYVFAEGLQDPGNLGALARSMEAAGASGLALAAGSAHPNHPRALRASAGSLLRLPVAVGVHPDDLRLHLKSIAPQWLALDPQGGQNLYQAELRGALVLLLGAEGPGLSLQLTALADRRLRIPTAGGVESLNAAVAAALALFEIRRRRLET